MCLVMREQAPTAAEIEALAREVLQRMPAPFAAHLANIVLVVEEFADEETLAELEIEDPFGLTGLYHGQPVGERGSTQSGAMPDRIHLYRRPILDEWCDTGDTLKALITHVVVHEVGHHFGLSDKDMHALEHQA
ncbi:MAG: neutral zinc metallopeptidase [Proteobacteria bacterium ST_bin14]|nr:MAG: neutral zinc metallopeptidase [Proteobacteria bacterium ST_bin14]